MTDTASGRGAGRFRAVGSAGDGWSAITAGPKIKATDTWHRTTPSDAFAFPTIVHADSRASARNGSCRPFTMACHVPRLMCRGKTRLENFITTTRYGGDRSVL